MREDFRPTVTVRLGDDGNPEINIDGTTMQAQQLCVALLAGLAMEISPADPVSFLTGMAISAGNLLDRMEPRRTRTMKRYLKICSVAFLAGVGAARVLIWLSMGIVHLLVMRGGWEAAAAAKAAPWVLAAVGGGLIFSVAVMLADSKHYEHSAQKQQQTTVKTSNERKAG